MLTDAEKKELKQIETRRLDQYIGFNLCREIFREEKDADRWLELQKKAKAIDLTYYSYGSPCRAKVQKGRWDGATTYEVYHG